MFKSVGVMKKCKGQCLYIDDINLDCDNCSFNDSHFVNETKKKHLKDFIKDEIYSLLFVISLLFLLPTLLLLFLLEVRV